MSSAFMKEEEGVPWIAPQPLRAYRVLWTGNASPEVLRETDDLLDALRWMGERGKPGFEIRDRAGALLATSDA